MAVEVAQLAVKVTADTSQATTALTGLVPLLAKTGPIALGAIAIGAGIAVIGGAAVKMAGDYNAGLTTLVTGAGLQASQLGKVHDSILQMAVDTGTSTQQLIAGEFMISSANLKNANTLDILKAAAEGAKVGHADLGVTANAVTTIMKDYASANVNAVQATNLTIATVSLGKTHMEDLAGSISHVLPVASKFGISLGDVMAGMATMTSHGIDAANAATYLRQMIISLESPTSAGAKALESVGLSAQDVVNDIKSKGLPETLQIITEAIGKHFPAGSSAALTAFKEIAGGSRQMQGMLALTGSSAAEFAADALKLNGVVRSTSTQITGWSTVQGTFNEQASRAKAAVEVLMISLGEHLLPVATQLMSLLANGLIPTVQNFIKFITGSSAAAQVLRPVLAVVAILIGGALVAAFIAWAVAAGAAAVATIAATWPILAAGAAIGLMVAALIWAYNNIGPVHTAIDGIRNGMGQWIPMIKEVIGWLGNFAGMIGNLLGKIGSLIGSLGNLKNVAGGIGNAVGGVFSHIPGFAAGGIVTSPTLAVIGESGPEAVVPLSGSGGAGAGSSSGLLQSTFIIQLDGHTIAQSTAKHLPGILRIATGTRQF